MKAKERVFIKIEFENLGKAGKEWDNIISTDTHNSAIIIQEIRRAAMQAGYIVLSMSLATCTVK